MSSTGWDCLCLNQGRGTKSICTLPKQQVHVLYRLRPSVLEPGTWNQKYLYTTQATGSWALQVETVCASTRDVEPKYLYTTQAKITGRKRCPIYHWCELNKLYFFAENQFTSELKKKIVVVCNSKSTHNYYNTGVLSYPNSVPMNNLYAWELEKFFLIQDST